MLNLPQICLVQICCKYKIWKALQPVQRWQWPNLPVFVQIRPLPPLHWLQSFANFIFATYLHQANLTQIRFFVLCIILDDLMAEATDSPVVSRLFTQGRHGNASVICPQTGQVQRNRLSMSAPVNDSSLDRNTILYTIALREQWSGNSLKLL